MTIYTRHFTSTVFVYQSGAVLLHPHPKLKKHLPPGGHVEENELPTDAALREVFEETGLVVSLLSANTFAYQDQQVRSIATPFWCLVEKIPANIGTKEHEHIDLIYIAIPRTMVQPLFPFQWFTKEKIESLLCPETIFLDTKQLALKVIETFSTNVFRDVLCYDPGIFLDPHTSYPHHLHTK